MVFFKTKKDKEIENLNAEIDRLKGMLNPDIQELEHYRLQLRQTKDEYSSIEKETEKAAAQLRQIYQQVENKKKELYDVSEEVEVQEFGLYHPKYDFAKSTIYAEKLAQIRNKQKQLIKSNMAVVGNTNWTVNNNKRTGAKLVSDTEKLLLRAFNTECDNIIDKVKYTNFDTSLNKIYKLSDSITKLGTVMNISITKEYIDSKVKELELAFEYRQKQFEEKEAQRQARAEQREWARAQRELEEQRKRIDKEQTHYETAYSHLCAQLKDDPQNSDLLEKKQEIESKLADIEKAIKEVDYRQANAKAGYVYVISNIGAFGPDVYKIGMTRRLDPQDRIDELGDASVPFNFDVHAMIFSDDAPALEAALHNAFADKKVNMVNQRREFFHVKLDDIKNVVKKNFDKTVEWTDIPEAEQYRVSQKIKSTNAAI